MNAELTLPLAFLVGLAGAGHCWAMCGGLVGGLFGGLFGGLLGGLLGGQGCGGCNRRQVGLLWPHLGYHAGRVLAYTLLGALAAGIGQAIVLTGEVGLAQAVLYVIAGLGVVLTGAWMLYSPTRPVMPGTNKSFAIAGFLNGLMPCALVFSITLKAATAPSVASGAAWLFAFGLGTVPAMALAGALAQGLGTQSLVWLRRAAGLLVMLLGGQAVWSGYRFFQVMLHL